MGIRGPYIKRNNWTIAATLLVIYVVFAPYTAAGEHNLSVTETKTISAKSIWKQVTASRQLWGPTLDSPGLHLIFPVWVRLLFQRFFACLVPTSQWIAVVLKHMLLAPIKFTSNYVVSRA